MHRDLGTACASSALHCLVRKRGTGLRHGMAGTLRNWARTQLWLPVLSSLTVMNPSKLAEQRGTARGSILVQAASMYQSGLTLTHSDSLLPMDGRM